MNYVFMTDSNCDMPFELKDKYDIPMVFMPYALEGVEHYADLGRSGSSKEFFNKMRNGATPITSCLSTDNYLDYFEPIFSKGNDLLFIAFSSQLSSTINFVREAKNILLKKYPERRFEIVDTLNISAPQSLLILNAHKLYREGKTMDEVIEYVEHNKQKANVWITIEDLVYLKRGGRISGSAHVMGTILDLKPIIVLNQQGKLVPVEKAKGRKKALRTIVNKVVENIESPELQEVAIIHADSLEDANRLEKLLRESLPNIKNCMIWEVGPVIGTHCGPGTVGIAFIGKNRPE